MAQDYPVPANWAARALIDDQRYRFTYARPLPDPDDFRRDEARRLTWTVPFTTVCDTSFDAADFRIRWCEDDAVDVSENGLDHHRADRGGDTALIWEGDEPGEGRRLSYLELHGEVCRFRQRPERRGRARGRPPHDLDARVRREIGPIATPDAIQ